MSGGNVEGRAQARTTDEVEEAAAMVEASSNEKVAAEGGQEEGVYYAPSDCLGFVRRLLIDLLDGVVLVLAWWLTAVVLILLQVPGPLAKNLYFVGMLGSSFLYLVVLKRFGRTLGYVVLGAEVVNLQGKRPSLWALLLRALFLALGPLTVLVDMMWMTSDPNRQAIRDKFARTYVVRRGSVPAGEGAIRYMRVDLLGYSLLFSEVRRVEARGAK